MNYAKDRIKTSDTAQYTFYFYNAKRYASRRRGREACAPRSTGRRKSIRHPFKTFPRRYTHVSGIVEAHGNIEAVDGVDLLLGEVELDVVQVLSHEDGVSSLGDDDDTLLGRPPEEDLSRSPVVCLGDGVDSLVLEEQRALVRTLPVELTEGEGTEGRVSHNSNLLRLSELDKVLLDEVRVVLCKTTVEAKRARGVTTSYSPTWRTDGGMRA